MLFAVVVVFLMCCSSHGGTEGACNTWTVPRGSNNSVCCKRCIDGYRIFKYCGPLLNDLCVPCEDGTFTLDPSQDACTKCSQCGGVKHTVAVCTRTKDTQCGCPAPLLCNDKDCAICVRQCGRGREPQGGSCRTCPAGSFNNQDNQKCKRWRSIVCTHPDEYMIRGDAYTDSRCVANSTITTTIVMTTQRHIESKTEEDTMQPWWLVITVSCGVLLIPLILMIRVITKLKARKGQTVPRKQPFITTPTDEPRTLMAIECSFHEPEQVSSSDSLATEDSEDSTHKLIV